MKSKTKINCFSNKFKYLNNNNIIMTIKYFKTNSKIYFTYPNLNRSFDFGDLELYEKYNKLKKIKDLYDRYGDLAFIYNNNEILFVYPKTNQIMLNDGKIYNTNLNFENTRELPNNYKKQKDVLANMSAKLFDNETYKNFEVPKELKGIIKTEIPFVITNILATKFPDAIVIAPYSCLKNAKLYYDDENLMKKLIKENKGNKIILQANTKIKIDGIIVMRK